MDFDRDELYAAMYNDEEEPEKTKEPSYIDPTGFSRTKKIRVGAVEYEVPTIEYVSRLEQLVLRQARVINQQKRHLERLEGFVLSTRNFIRRQTNRIAEIQTDLDGKIDYREFP